MNITQNRSCTISFRCISLSTITMPRRKCCQYSTRHENSAPGSKKAVPLSSQLSTFLINQYDLTDVYIRWLCPKYHSLKTKEMETTDSRSSSDNESIIKNPDTADDDSSQEEIDYDNQEDEEHCYMDNDMESGSIKDNDDDDSESMDEESDDVLHDLVYQQNEAKEKLSTIFHLLNIAPIHDK